MFRQALLAIGMLFPSVSGNAAEANTPGWKCFIADKVYGDGSLHYTEKFFDSENYAVYTDDGVVSVYKLNEPSSKMSTYRRGKGNLVGSYIGMLCSSVR